MYSKCEELVRLLVHASRGNQSARTRKAMELLAMHHLDGRLVYATHYLTYRWLSKEARKPELEILGGQLWSDITGAQSAVTAALQAQPSVCPMTRRMALLTTLLENPILQRRDVAENAHVSVETAGRWLERLRQRGLLRVVRAGNIAIYFVAPTVIAVLRQVQLMENRPSDNSTLKRIFAEPVVIAMDPYRSGYSSAGDVSVRERRW